MSYLPPRIIPYPLTHQSGDSQLGIDTNGIGDCNSPILFGDGEEPIPVLVVLTGKQWERIYGALLFGADVIYPNAREQVLFDFTKWWDCPLDICQIIQDCIGAQLEAIQASVDALSTSVTNISNTVNNIETSTDNSAVKPPTGITFTDGSFRCGGALALIDYMHAKNMQIYAEAEASAVDNISEMIISVLSAIPALETLPVGALGALTQSYFENQVTTYEADFALARLPMASLLACMVGENGNQMTYDVWGDWLELVEAEVPANTAAQLFARYSPARQTLINQIAALLNSESSLQSYFSQLFAAYNAGSDNPSNACEECAWTFTVTASNKPSWMTFLYGTLTDNDFAGVYPTSISSNNWAAIQVDWTFPANVNLTSISWKMVTASNVQTSGAIFYNDYIISKNASNATYASGNMVRDTTVDQVKTLNTSSQLAKSGQIQSIMRRASAPQPEFSFELTFNGIGYNPFE